MRNNNGIVFGKNNFGKVVKKKMRMDMYLLLDHRQVEKQLHSRSYADELENRAFVIDVKGELFRKTKKQEAKIQ